MLAAPADDSHETCLHPPIIKRHRADTLKAEADRTKSDDDAGGNATGTAWRYGSALRSSLSV